MYFTDEEFNDIASCEQEMVTIVVNKSMAFIPIAFREKMLKYNLKLGFHQSCTTCSSALHNMVTNVYEYWKRDRIERENNNGNKPNKDVKKRNTGRKKREVLEG